MKRYSEFINFPIYLWASKEVDVEVPADEDESSDEEETCNCQFFFYFLIFFSDVMKISCFQNCI